MSAAAAPSPQQDFTKGPLGKAIIALAIPMVLEMLMESVFAIVDIFFVGDLGATAVATIGLTESLMTVVYTIAMGLAIGAAAVTARRTGEGDSHGAAVATMQALLLGLGASLLMSVVGLAFTDELLGLMGAGPEVIAEGGTYARIMLGGNAAVLFLFLANAAFRGAGDAWIAMRSLWLANAINLVLCPLLVYGIDGWIPALGVTGAGIATTGARAAGAGYVLWRLFRGGGRLHVRKEHFALSPTIMGHIASLSASGTFQMFIGTASWIGLVRVVSTFGSTALAGYTIGIRIIVFAIMPAFGLGNAAATLVGQCLGAGDPNRSEKAVWIAAFYSAIFLGLVGVIFFFAADPIVSLFTKDPEVHAYASLCLKMLSFGYPFFAYGMVVTQAFNGAGDTWTPTWINFGVFWLFEIPIAIWFAITLGVGPRGVFYAITFSFVLLAVVASLVFKRGKWKSKVV